MYMLGCPNCKTLEVVCSFNWKLAQNSTDVNHLYTGSFKPKEDLKKGTVYESICCNSMWYLAGGNFMYLLNPARQEILDDWSKRDLQVPKQMRAVLAAIGTNTRYSKPFEEFPCKVEFKDKSINEFCLLRTGFFPLDFLGAISGKKKQELHLY